MRSKKPGVGPLELDQIELAVAGEIEELLASAAEGRERGLARDPFDGREARGDDLAAVLADEVDRAQVALVEPAVGLLGEDAGEPFAVEIDPLVVRCRRGRRAGSRGSRGRPREPSSLRSSASLYSNSSGGSDFLR